MALQYTHIVLSNCYVRPITELTDQRGLRPRKAPSVELSSAERIRDAALKCFAENGVSATTLREVARAAGISVGLVQHYYRTKAALTAAVDEYVLAIITDALVPQALPPLNPDTATEMGVRVTTLMAEEPVVVDYVGRAIIEGGSIGAEIFDGIVTISEQKRDVFVERREVRPDLDLLWAALLPVTMRLGAILLRSHLDRHLPEPFNTPSQLRRWDTAIISLLREGQSTT